MSLLLPRRAPQRKKGEHHHVPDTVQDALLQLLPGGTIPPVRRMPQKTGRTRIRGARPTTPEEATDLVWLQQLSRELFYTQTLAGEPSGKYRVEVLCSRTNLFFFIMGAG